VAAVTLAGPRATLTVLATGRARPRSPAKRSPARSRIVGVAGPHPDLVVEAAAMCRKGRGRSGRRHHAHRRDPLRTHVSEID